MRDANRAEFLELKQGERFEAHILDAHKAAAGDHQKFAAELRQAGFDIVRRSERIETEKPVTATT